jgi:hypothetical protein
MPGFGDNPNTDTENDGMFNADMLAAVAQYEADLHLQDEAATGGTTTTTAATGGTTTTTVAPTTTTTKGS